MYCYVPRICFILVEHKDFLSSIITKTLKLGVDTKLCNTVYGSDFIYLHEVMQGSSREKLRLKNGETFYLTQKLNGEEDIRW